MTDFTLITRYRNKDQCEKLIQELRAKGKTCYNFCETPADPNNPDAPPEEQMKEYEQEGDFYNSQHHQYVFQEDLEGLKKAKKVILLLPAGTSSHIEAGIAYGLGKPLILIGQPEKAESLYLIFNERYSSIEEFLKKIK